MGASAQKATIPEKMHLSNDQSLLAQRERTTDGVPMDSTSYANHIAILNEEHVCVLGCT